MPVVGYRPKRKRILNTWLAESEWLFLKHQAAQAQMTLTSYLRERIRSWMASEGWNAQVGHQLEKNAAARAEADAASRRVR